MHIINSSSDICMYRIQQIDRLTDRQTEIWTANKTDEIQMSRRKYMYSKMNGSVVKNA